MPKRTVTVSQVDVFTRELFRGNPAGVVFGGEALAESEMQALARELNNSDTAFVLPPDAPDHDVHVRFFTPLREAAFVGHATVAAHVARLAAGVGAPGKLRQKTRSGVLEVEIAGSTAEPTVAVAFPPPELLSPISEATRNRLLDIFGMESAALDPKCPILITKRNSTRLMMGLRSADQLAALDPQFDELKRLTPHVGADGYFLFVRNAHGPGTSESRMFTPVLGIPEDPVSGNAHGMLGAYLVAQGLLTVDNGRARLHGFQGRSMHRPGEVHVEIEAQGRKPTRIRMSGTARIVFTTEIALG